MTHKQSKKTFAVLALAFIIALALAACDSGFGGDGGNTDPRLNGTWVDEYGRDGFTFNNGTFELFEGLPVVKGTYTTTNSTLTLTETHYYGYALGDSFVATKWYSRAELMALGVPEDYYLNTLPTTPISYSISGNTLYLTYAGDTATLTRR
jgi:hypothetical protein